jgi:hypothetical protein
MAGIFGEVPFPTLPETDGCLQQKIHTALDTKKILLTKLGKQPSV